MIDIGGLQNRRISGMHPDHGAYVGVILGAFIAVDTMGDVAVSELRLVAMCERCGALITVPVDSAKLQKPTGISIAVNQVN